MKRSWKSSLQKILRHYCTRAGPFHIMIVSYIKSSLLRLRAM